MSAAQNATSDLIESFNQKLNSVAPGAVGIQLALMVGVGLVALGAFSLLRPNNSVVYQPKVKYAADEKRPPKLGKGFFDWIVPVVKTGEQEMMATIGLDSVAYLRFLRMCRNMFLCIAGLCCAVLIPINVAYNLNYVNSNSRNYLLMLTMSKVRSNWLWAHVVVTYVVTAMAFYFIWRNYSIVVKLRWQWFRSPAYQDMLYARSLMVTHVAKKYQTDAGLAGLLASLNIPYPTTAVHIGRRVGALPALIKKHNETVKELEEVLTTYLRHPDHVPTSRPTKRIGGKFGLGGQTVDSIDYLTEKIKRLEERIEAARAQIHERKPENYGFASFESVPYAHIVAKTLLGKRRHNAYFELAPQPSDLIWENLTMSPAARTKNKFFGGLLLVLLCGLYTIPLVAVSLLANLAALSAYVDFIDAWVRDYPWLFSAFVGIVPPVLTLLLQMILPMIIRWIASLQGATTHSQSDRIVTARYSAFLFITQFIIFSLLGVIFQIVSQVVLELQGHASTSKIFDYLETIPQQLQNTYMIQSNYWLTVFPLRGASACFDLAQIISLLLVWVKTHFFGRTPREIREATKPPFFDFPVYYSNSLLLVVVALVYAPIAPLVALFGVGAFAIQYWVSKYNLLYVAVPRSETGGRLWNVAINRCLMALILMHIFMGVSIGLQTKRWLYAVILVPPIVAVCIFKVFLDRSFRDRFRWYIPGEAEMAAVHMHHADARKNRLQKRFGHDALSEPLYTPMLHKSVQHLLPTIYNGRIGQSEGKVEGKTVEQNTAGGLTFAMMEAHDLEIDRAAYLRQRDEDEVTVTTAAALGHIRTTPGSVAGFEGDDYFDTRRAEYLKHGATYSRSSTPFKDGDGDLPLELQRMPTSDAASFFGMDGRHTPNASTEQLIQPYSAVIPAAYPPSYSSPPRRSSPQHVRGLSGSPAQQHPRGNMSQSSFSSVMGQLPGASVSALDMAQYGSPAAGQRPIPQRQYTGQSAYESGDWRPQHAPTRSGQSSVDFGAAGARPGSRQGSVAMQGYPPAVPYGGGSGSPHSHPASRTGSPAAQRAGTLADVPGYSEYGPGAGATRYAPLGYAPADESTEYLPEQHPPPPGARR
ncbi:uncharacterized protein JCM10292_005362 [Rhodotorula paludigena]|uniref:uncharacterized protein n=1 Tax=Rhodotorula paludigena TaxID=86838 RepID=UPI003174A4BE